jgi:[CysO sulfur-carrier protein]-S-L-cysteine hydrolase
MKVLLPNPITKQLVLALRQAGRREIGGILMGEHVDTDTFRVKAITVQPIGGTPFSFRRMFRNILRPLRRFFRETNYNYTKFNYLGEWHSHPSFSPEPSPIDDDTMWELAQDPQVGANFIVLLIVRLAAPSKLEGTVTVYLPDSRHFYGELVQEKNSL